MTKENGATRKVILNDRGLFFIIGMILVLTFALGYVTCKGVEGNKTTTFTEEEIDSIIAFRRMNNEVEFEATNMFVCKDKNGKLMIGWEMEETEQWSFFGKR